MLLKTLCIFAIFIVLSGNIHALAYEWQTSLKLDGVTSVAKTHDGIYAGEFDSRTWLSPYRGIYFSTDLGETWSQAGLKDRGVMAISYDKVNKILYAATYYSVFDPVSGANRGGLFVLKDGVWYHTGPSVSTAGILATKDVVLLGTNAHGLWASYDKGENWTQKIGTGYFGPKFRVIKQSGERIFAHDEFNVYMTDNYGNSFTNIAALKDEKIADIEGNGQIVIAGTSNNRGAFISRDNGNTWTKIQQLEGKIVGKIKYFPLSNTFYAYVKDAATQDIYFSTNSITWQRTNFITERVTSIEWVFSEPSVLLAAAADDGLYRTTFNSFPIQINQIFTPPWTLNASSELTDRISTFFDHAYPFLGYSIYAEPAELASTTTNYLGITKPEPFQYYSSHDGIDFALPYGTSVKAVAKGQAQYAHQPNGLGHYIKITHSNNYQTFYGHLQEYPAKNFENPTQVEQGQTIGLVGLSGRTTGPHLHFTVLNDLNKDQLFENDVPEGKTDPFGWQSSAKADPWSNFTWTDALRTHTTSANSYLWSEPLQTKTAYTGKNPQISFDELELDFSSEQMQLLTPIIKRLPSASLKSVFGSKMSVPTLAFSIELYNNFGDRIEQFDTFVPLVFRYAESTLSNTVQETLNIYHFDEANNMWESLQTVNDQINKTLIANTNKFSSFAVFGNKTDSNPPLTQSIVTGQKLLGRYVNSVNVTLTANDTDYQSQITYIFYKINGSEWHEYLEPITFTESGAYTITYKSMDEHQNMEPEKTLQFEIDQNLIKHKVRIKSATFSIQ